jgi:hypothetical protein
MDILLAKPPQDAATIRTLRRGIGVVALALPVVLTVGNILLARRFTLLGSISGSYYTAMRDVFVGSMCAIGVFLICYRYEKRDDRLSTLAGVLAIAVALFRTTSGDPTVKLTSTDTAIGWVHQLSAVALFVVLAYFCFFLFTRTDSAKQPSPRKRLRNRLYRACGGVILACMGLAALANALPAAARDTIKPLFWCEAIAVLAFGAAWMVKGETIFRDAQADLAAVATGPMHPTPLAGSTSMTDSVHVDG